MTRSLPTATLLTALLCAGLAAAPALAADAPAGKPSAKSKTAKKAGPAKKAEPKVEAPSEVLTDSQLAVAQRVFTGRADCEFKQSVEIEPAANTPGHFDVRFGKVVYRMTPEETTTGAVRLHDRRADVVWLQIPVKSMLMDHKNGHRLVDACQHPQQRAAVEALEQTRVAAEAAATAASAAQTAASAATTSVAQPALAAAAAAAEKAAVAASSAATAASAAMPGGSAPGQPATAR